MLKPRETINIGKLKLLATVPRAISSCLEMGARFTSHAQEREVHSSVARMCMSTVRAWRRPRAGRLRAVYAER